MLFILIIVKQNIVFDLLSAIHYNIFALFSRFDFVSPYAAAAQ